MYLGGAGEINDYDRNTVYEIINEPIKYKTIFTGVKINDTQRIWGFLKNYNYNYRVIQHFFAYIHIQNGITSLYPFIYWSTMYDSQDKITMKESTNV